MTPLLKAGVDYPFPIVSAIVERERDGQVEILVQTRWKPGQDPKYSGTMEIPAGGIGPYENVYDALRREVYEETGLRVVGFRPDVQTRLHSQRGDAAFAFVPFCCQQETEGKPRIGFVFVCRVEEGEPRPGPGEVREIRWMNKDELKEMLAERAEEVFTFQLGALDFYLNYGEEGAWDPATG